MVYIFGIWRVEPHVEFIKAHVHLCVCVCAGEMSGSPYHSVFVILSSSFSVIGQQFIQRIFDLRKRVCSKANQTSASQRFLFVSSRSNHSFCSYSMYLCLEEVKAVNVAPVCIFALRKSRLLIVCRLFCLHQVAYESRSHLRAPGLSSSLPGSSGGKPWVFTLLIFN